MANQVLMPQMGISEESAVLAQWIVKEGVAVSVGDELFSLETGKAAFTAVSEYAGTVLKLLIDEGDEVPISAPVCVIGQPGEAVETPAPAAPVKEAPVKAEAAPAAAHAENPPSSGETKRPSAVSPRARMLAANAGADASLAVPTGPENRIIERDVRTLIASGAAAEAKPAETPAQPTKTDAVSGGYTDKKLSNMRKIIAKNMSQSLAQAAQLTHTASFDASNIQDYRRQLKQNPDTAGVTLTDMVLYAVSRTLPRFPALNAWLMENDTMRFFDTVNLACAVDTDRGLMVPVITNASAMPLTGISKQLKSLAAQCREGSVDPALLSGGSFTVSNLGSYGIESFTPILNTPQTGILGVNTITQRVRAAENGEITAYPCMSLSLTYDHRAIDGAPASAFLQALCRGLEQFTALLAGG